jgi:hypothetical protein
MKKLTAEDLFSLQYGDRVYRFRGTDMHPYRYVNRMPGAPDRYLIFSEGENLTHLYIHTDGTFKDEWYSGDYDSDFVDSIEIERLEIEIERLKKRLGTLKTEG